MPIRALLFDFDGTLADSFDAITDSTNHVRRMYGLPDLSRNEISRHVGHGLDQLMRDLVPPAVPAEAVALYRRHHADTMFAGTRLFPGVADTVRTLHARGFGLAVCSNKRVEFTKQLVSALGLGEFFAAVLGPEDVGAAKPDPAMLLEGLRRLSVSTKDAVYVGDMVVDVQTAKAAGVAVWIVPDGAGRDDPQKADPDRVLRSFAEILELV